MTHKSISIKRLEEIEILPAKHPYPIDYKTQKICDRVFSSTRVT